MTEPMMSKAELLNKIDQGWNDFQAYVTSLSPMQVMIPTDAAGWSALDHIIHLADWEKGVLAMLNKEDRAAAMGVDAATWHSQDYDKINAILQQRSKGKSLPEAYGYVMSIHTQFVEKVRSMSEAELMRPYKYYQPNSEREAPVIEWVMSNSFEHYEEHQPWIDAIVMNAKPLSKAELVGWVKKGWDDLNGFLSGLSNAQKVQLTDAAGWTVKDHVIHCAAWEDGLVAMLEQKDRRVYMEIDEETWKSGDDPINAVIQKRYQSLTWDEVEAKRQTIHAHLLQVIDGMPEAVLQAPNPKSKSKRAIFEYVLGSTTDHYNDHIPWMVAIAEGKR